MLLAREAEVGLLLPTDEAFPPLGFVLAGAAEAFEGRDGPDDAA